jgi:hypothetical protein
MSDAAEDLFVRTSGRRLLKQAEAPAERRNVKENTMYEEGFDIQAVEKRLKAEFAVEQKLPLKIALWLQHLQRREEEEARAN